MASGPIPLTARMGVWQQDLTADQAATDWYCPSPGDFTLGVSGIWTGSLKVQRSFDGGVTAVDYTTLDQPFAPTTNFSTDFSQSERNVLWRMIFNRSSGTATPRFGQ